MCIHSAQNLLPMDKNGLSDPYCIVYANKKEVGQLCAFIIGVDSGGLTLKKIDPPMGVW